MNNSNSDVNMNISPGLERSTLTAIFPDRAAARHTIDDLSAFGLRDDQISVAMQDRSQQDKLIADTGTHATEGAASGAGGDRARGGLYGLMTGLHAIIFPVKTRGALATAPGTAATGGVIGALMGMQIPEAEARQRESGFRKGSVLVTAKVYEGVAEAQSIMQHNGGGWVNRAEQPAVG